MDTAAAWREQARTWHSLTRQRANLACPGMHPDHATDVAHNLDALIARCAVEMERLEDQWLAEHPPPW